MAGHAPAILSCPPTVDEALRAFVLEFLDKHGFRGTAGAMRVESTSNPDLAIPDLPVDSGPVAFLSQWFCVFWDLYASRTKHAFRKESPRDIYQRKLSTTPNQSQNEWTGSQGDAAASNGVPPFSSSQPQGVPAPCTGLGMRSSGVNIRPGSSFATQQQRLQCVDSPRQNFPVCQETARPNGPPPPHDAGVNTNGHIMMNGLHEPNNSGSSHRPQGHDPQRSIHAHNPVGHPPVSGSFPLQYGQPLNGTPMQRENTLMYSGVSPLSQSTSFVNDPAHAPHSGRDHNHGTRNTPATGQQDGNLSHNYGQLHVQQGGEKRSGGCEPIVRESIRPPNSVESSDFQQPPIAAHPGKRPRVDQGFESFGYNSSTAPDPASADRQLSAEHMANGVERQRMDGQLGEGGQSLQHQTVRNHGPAQIQDGMATGHAGNQIELQMTGVGQAGSMTNPGSQRCSGESSLHQNLAMLRSECQSAGPDQRMPFAIQAQGPTAGSATNFRSQSVHHREDECAHKSHAPAHPSPNGIPEHRMQSNDSAQRGAFQREREGIQLPDSAQKGTGDFGDPRRQMDMQTNVQANANSHPNDTRLTAEGHENGNESQRGNSNTSRSEGVQGNSAAFNVDLLPQNGQQDAVARSSHTESQDARVAGFPNADSPGNQSSSSRRGQGSSSRFDSTSNPGAVAAPSLPAGSFIVHMMSNGFVYMHDNTYKMWPSGQVIQMPNAARSAPGWSPQPSAVNRPRRPPPFHSSARTTDGSGVNETSASKGSTGCLPNPRNARTVPDKTMDANLTVNLDSSPQNPQKSLSDSSAAIEVVRQRANGGESTRAGIEQLNSIDRSEDIPDQSDLGRVPHLANVALGGSLSQGASTKDNAERNSGTWPKRDNTHIRNDDDNASVKSSRHDSVEPSRPGSGTPSQRSNGSGASARRRKRSGVVGKTRGGGRARELQLRNAAIKQACSGDNDPLQNTAEQLKAGSLVESESAQVADVAVDAQTPAMTSLGRASQEFPSVDAVAMHDVINSARPADGDRRMPSTVMQFGTPSISGAPNNTLPGFVDYTGGDRLEGDGLGAHGAVNDAVDSVHGDAVDPYSKASPETDALQLGRDDGGHAKLAAAPNGFSYADEFQGYLNCGPDDENVLGNILDMSHINRLNGGGLGLDSNGYEDDAGILGVGDPGDTFDVGTGRDA